MNNDLISRAAVFKAIYSRHTHDDMNLAASVELRDVLDVIASIPAVDAEKLGVKPIGGESND